MSAVAEPGGSPASQAQVPVLISGGGSVGLCLAAELGWRGVECLVIEEREGLNDHPRANAVANRTMEYFRRWGIDEAVTRAGIPPSLPAEYLWVSTLHGRELHRVSLPPFDELALKQRSGVSVNEEHSWSPYLKTITGQDEVERVVLDFVNSRPEVDTRFGWRLVSFDVGNGLAAAGLGDPRATVRCELEDVATGQREEIETTFLVGCDGGRSTVRRQLGIGLSGRADLARFVSVYFRSPELIHAHPFGHGNIFFPLHRRHRGFLLTWDDDKTYTYHIVLDDGEDWTDVDPHAAIRDVVGAPIDIDIHSVQPWTAHALVADAYQRGNVFLAGDAAHLFSPTGGFGMNTGVSDAVDLAWRLQSSLAGWAGSGLLESYGIERRPVGIRNTMEAADCFDRLFAVMQHGDVLDEDSPEADAVRTELQADLKDQEKLVASSGTLLGYRYENSPIVVPDGTPEPPDDARRYTPVARPGHRAPHCWLDTGDSIYDVLGPDFTLLVFERSAAGDPDSADGELSLDDVDSWVDAWVDAAAERAIPLRVVNLSEPEAAALYEASAALIRPDLMVAWRSVGSASRPDPGPILDTARGANPTCG